MSGYLPYEFPIVLGDWSDDGHGETQNVCVRCSHTIDELHKSYKASCEKTGIFFADEVASGYNDPTMTSKAVEIFTQFDCPFEELLSDIYGWDESEPLTDLSLEPTQYVRLLMWFIGLSLYDLKYEERKGFASFHIHEPDHARGNTSFFGYGLFPF